MPAARPSATMLRTAAVIAVAALAAWGWWWLCVADAAPEASAAADAAAERSPDSRPVDAPAPGSAGDRAVLPPETRAERRETAPPERIGAPVPRADTIEGTVTGEDGAPIAKAEVHIDGVDGEVITDEFGRFVCVRQPEDPVQVALRYVESGRDEYEDLLVDRWLPWRTRDLQLVLRRRVAVEVALVDASGEPVDCYVTLSESGPLGKSWEARSTSERPHAMFPHVARGTCSLQCLTSRNDGVTPPRRAIEISSGARITLVFEPWVSRTIVVVGSDGSPIEGSRVSLAAPGESASYRDLLRTDKSGQATLVGGAAIPCRVHVTGRHVPVVVEGVRLGDREPLRITVGAAAPLWVRLTPPLDADLQSELQLRFGLRREHDGVVRYAWRDRADGALRVDAELGAWTFAILDGPLAGPLANVNLTGFTTEIDVALPPIVAASIKPTVACDQVSVSPNDYVFLLREPRRSDLGELTRYVGVPVSQWETKPLPAGRYRARLRRIPQAVSDEAVELAPGATVDAHFRVRLGDVAIKLLDESGEPQRDARIGLVRDGLLTDEDELASWTDGDGIVRSPCGVGRLQVVVLPQQPYSATTGGGAMSMVPLYANVEPRTFVGTITVREGTLTEATFVLR